MAWQSSPFSTDPWRIMHIIFYKNIRKEYIESLKEIADGYVLEEYQGQEVLPEETVLFLLGEDGPGMINTIQKINKKNPLLSLLIFPATPGLNRHLKMAIQFSPFINENIKVIESPEKNELEKVIKNEANLTITRKKFKKTQDRSRSKLSKTLNSDSLLRANFLDNFLLQAPVGVILLDKNDVVLDLNEYAKGLFGKNLNLISKKFTAFFTTSWQKVQKFLKNRNNPNEDVFVDIKGSEGKIKHVKLFMSEIVTANTVYKMIILLDVTREILAEQNAQIYLNELEKRNKELEQFASVVSHDLKNPLSTIKLSCEMAVDSSMEEKNRYLSIINRSSDNLLQMIQGLEEIIDVRKDKQIASPLEFQDIFNNILNEYQYQIKMQEITITCDFDKAPSINYIESYLISIFHNMISNAIKYSQEDEPLRMHIGTEKNYPYILLKFSDNGIGIDLEENAKNLFQPFKRFSRQAEGKGIGLSIIKSMIEKNNGKIEVESTLGVGTTFLCFLRPYEVS
jgi:signal transduction histidine kinase